ncbi:hypothetical protein BB559_001224 [Furculomyces boomerangus]|uniref:SPX domain-containing protein n=2 Tax=Harpellales TaxID=61421 RepID=A0A2T9Z2N0_9FUNG|nr:hypothetical protein BB559_001224 [Furculomyces boomerangus]PWA03655.1 hypothetical protein BB558_000138 [Smittium angustum]
MKFSSVLKFNAVPEWTDKYISYSQLKKIIYIIEKEQVMGTGASVHISPEESEQFQDLEAGYSENIYGFPESQKQIFGKFVVALDKDILKIEEFYRQKEEEVVKQTDKLQDDYEKYLERFEEVIELLDLDSASKTHVSLTSPEGYMSLQGTTPDGHRNSLSVSDIANTSDINRPNSNSRNRNPNRLSRSHFSSTQLSSDLRSEADSSDGQYDSAYEDMREAALKIKVRQANNRKRILNTKARELFISVSDLQLYSKLNLTGFNKILKKFDKVTGQSLKETYNEKVLSTAYSFSTLAKSVTNNEISKIITIFTEISGYSSQDEAIEELKASLRDQVVWDRNTVWRDMISMERKVGAVEVVHPTVGPSALNKGQIQNWSKESVQFLYIFLCLMGFTFSLLYSPFADLIQQRCWALLVFVSLMWATEAIPLHVTAMFVPMLVVILNVMRDPSTNEPLVPADSAKLIFSSMFSHVIMLLLGGFTIAAALSKHNLAKIGASYVLSKVGESCESVVLANMFVATFASMWISNVAAPVLCFSLIQPILRTLPTGHPLAPCLIIGIALASNVGGMASPIASPQNIIAIGIMDPPPSWLQWFMVSIPTCIVCNLGIWFVLMLVYRPSSVPVKLNRTRFIPEKLNSTQWYVIAISALTIVFWCLAPSLSGIFGNMGVLAIFPIVFLFSSSGILSKEDFNNFLWTVVVLAMGGSALGKAVESSGLLTELSRFIAEMVNGLSPYYIMCAFCTLVLVICTFISHTVGALIILPIVYEVGVKLPGDYSRMLVMSSALMASGAMGLPVSGFPNMNAIMIEDATGEPYLTVQDFFVAGIPSSVVAYFVIITISYFFMYISGF